MAMEVEDVEIHNNSKEFLNSNEGKKTILLFEEHGFVLYVKNNYVFYFKKKHLDFESYFFTFMLGMERKITIYSSNRHQSTTSHASINYGTKELNLLRNCLLHFLELLSLKKYYCCFSLKEKTNSFISGVYEGTYFIRISEENGLEIINKNGDSNE